MQKRTLISSVARYLIILLVILVTIAGELALLKKSGRIELIVGLNAALGSLLLFFLRNGKFQNVMLLLYFAPLLLLSNKIHYQLKYEIVFALPLFILALYTFYIYLLNPIAPGKDRSLTKVLVLFMLYFLGIGIYGKLRGFQTVYVFYESYHVLLYISIMIISFNMRERNDYYFIFYGLLAIFMAISLGYIALGYIGSGKRFVTFQSGFLPLTGGVIFSLILAARGNLKRIIYFAMLVTIILAMFSTLTRTLWVTTIITLASVYVIYLIAEKKFTITKKILVFVYVILTVVYTAHVIRNLNPYNRIKDNTKTLEQRVESIQNPTEDHSFLMRVELGWYAIEKFIRHPIFGWGLGDYLRFKYLGDPRLKNIYLDNSWLYFLWKGGIIGFLLFALVFYKSIKLGIIIVRETDSARTRALTIGITGGLIGLAALGFLSPLLIKYRTNVLLAFIWAYFEFEYNNLRIANDLR